MKKLGKLDLREIEETFSGKVWVFVPVCAYPDNVWALGVAVTYESGYTPAPVSYCNAEEGPTAYDDISKHCDELNAARGFGVKASTLIISTTMKKGK